MSRGGFKITRSDYYETDSSDRIDWLDRFARDLDKKNSEPKSAVEVARARNNQSIIDQINSIVGNKPRHSNVESLVQEMQERTGLKEYLQRNSASQTQSKVAALPEQNEKKVILENLNNKLREKIINFIKNRIETHRGLVSLPAIQEEIISTFKNEGAQPQDINNPEVANFINQVIIDERRKTPSLDTNDGNLGRGVGVQEMDDDGANSDFFRGLMPATKASTNFRYIVEFGIFENNKWKKIGQAIINATSDAEAFASAQVHLDEMKKVQDYEFDIMRITKNGNVIFRR